MDVIGPSLIVLAVMGLLFWRLRSRRSSDPADEIRRYYRKHRHPAIVIDQILKEIPHGEFEELKRELGHIRQKSLFTAPEVMQPVWVDLMDTLGRQLGEVDTPWKKRVQAIMKEGVS